ncbi:MAG: exonuclease domain-containing protein [Chitinophagaceae bacterium]
MFAIVDIETTGGYEGANNITEIAIVLHNGKEIEGKYSTLVNPCMPIQKYVQSLTGITDSMVAKAPKFSAVAENVFNLLQNRIFVAHNVNFDYSYVKNELQLAGFQLTTPKLCTIRLTKKIFPNLPKYGLGTVCTELNIQVKNRHRAAGDALATAELFSILIQNDTSGELARMLKKKSEQYLPPLITEKQLADLPTSCGVYYFYDKKNTIIYVGKAKNIRKRVTTHFSNNRVKKQKHDFLREVVKITYQECVSELVASVLESFEIKKLWPSFNKSQKHYEHQYGIFMFEDAKGYYRLGIDKNKKLLKPLVSFSLRTQAHSTLWQWSKQYQLHPALCFLDRSKAHFSDLPNVQEHNALVNQLIETTKSNQKTYLIQETNNYCIFIDEGSFYGMGNVDASILQKQDTSIIKSLVTRYPENEVVKGLLQKHVQQYPHKVIWF